MDEQMERKGEFGEVNLRHLFDVLLNKAWVVVSTSLAGAVITFLITFFFITPKYQAAAMFYVNNNAISVGNASLSISNGDLVTSRGLVDSYIVILNTRETLNDVLDYAASNLSYSSLRSMISASAVNETEIFQVSVTSPDPQEAERLANAIAYILPKRINTIIEGTSAKIVDSAVVPSSPSSPSYVTNTLLGFLLGFVMSAGVIVLQEIFDITIRREEDVTQITRLPILASVPDMMGHSKGGRYHRGYYQYRSYYHSYYDTSKSASASTDKSAQKGKNTNRDANMIGDAVPFTASEAYKLLRTKIQFSFADENNCHIIGVSSALAGEGKSTTSVNLAFTLSQLGKKVLLVDCDLRRPSISTKLNFKQEHGLSGFLTRQADLEQIVRECRFKSGTSFVVIPAGKIPPNPTELLNSNRMERFMSMVTKNFDYVILDLPPVEEVSDALVAAKLADGVLLTVRQNYCNRIALADTISQFEFVNGRILGLLLTCSDQSTAGYGKSYYKRYYRRYGYGRYRHYAKAYEDAHKEASDKTETK